MMSELGEASHSLSDLDAAIAKAEAMGGCDGAVEEAKKSRSNLLKQDVVLSECKNAIASNNYEDLKLTLTQDQHRVFG